MSRIAEEKFFSQTNVIEKNISNDNKHCLKYNLESYQAVRYSERRKKP